MEMDLKPNISKAQTSYDKIPYNSHSFSQTHPNRLATLGQLFGLSPTPVGQCRVLELGCASGANLIPMAYHLPNSEFVGVDLSIRQVEMASNTITALDLKNIEIKHASILDINKDWGEFDYILCHGVFSWVSIEVQEKILSISSENLSPNGISYISYNTYPGWHMRESIRHMMLFHSSQFDETQQRIDQARALINFLANAVPTENNHYGMLLKSELDLINNSNDSYLFHEHLEETNTPIYFNQFIERCDNHQLQYLSEADIGAMLTKDLTPHVIETLGRLSTDIIKAEQYMDFLRNRHFRQTLLCNKNHKLTRELSSDNIGKLLISASTKTDSIPNELTSNKKQIFYTSSGLKIDTNFPLTKIALTILNNNWPKAIEVNALVNDATNRLGKTLSEAQANNSRLILLDDLLHCYTSNIVEFHTWQAPVENVVSSKPKTSELARYQLQHGEPIVNQRFETVNLDFFGKELFKILDGIRDRKSILNHLQGMVEKGSIVIKNNNQEVPQKQIVNETLENIIQKTLDSFARMALLVK